MTGATALRQATCAVPNVSDTNTKLMFEKEFAPTQRSEVRRQGPGSQDRIYPAMLQGRQDVQDQGRVGSDILTPCE